MYEIRLKRINQFVKFQLFIEMIHSSSKKPSRGKNKENIGRVTNKRLQQKRLGSDGVRRNSNKFCQ